MINRMQNFIRNDKETLVMFLLVGVMTASFYFGIFFLLWKLCALNYYIAISIAYVLAIILHFNASRHFTFKNKETAIAQQFGRFLIMILLNYVLTLIIVHTIVEIMFLPPYWGVLIAIFATTCFNYFFAKLWVFNIAKT